MKIVTPNIKHQTQTGISGNQRCIVMPAVVNSRPVVFAQLNQYNHPIVKPVAGLINLVAYSWKDPETGMATASSPRQSITKYINNPPAIKASTDPPGPA
ncbi:Uncharacterised protein [Streptococcus pneumoniae]|nr:Uncharacterised protein [Streptococcus pneumoniae]CKG25924.1 Uncharacterised protein [Streptococcus pneumoniae]CKH07333.1 Uncharacterised protein [Streptococcus pneumoniae]